MPKTFLAALVISLVGGAGIGAPVAARDSATRIERLARVARLWGTVKFLHPYLAYRDIDWDAALVAAIPKIRQAASVEEYRQAVDEMLKALGDPVTTVVSAETPPDRKAPPWTALYKKETDGLIVVDLWQQLDAAPRGELFPAVQSLKKQLPLSPAVVVDLRTGQGGWSFWSDYILRDLARALVPGPVQAPTERFVMHSGYRPQSGTTSGGYYSGFVTQSADTFEPEGELPAQGRKVVFLFDSNSNVPSVALALQARGMARFVTQGKLDESRLATTRDVDLGEGLRASVRVSEWLAVAGGTGLHADVEAPPDDSAAALAAAIAEARKEWPSPKAAAPAATPSAPAVPVFRADKRYPEMTTPSLEYRQLAVVRAWNVIHWFYPYKPLIADWDAVLPEFLGRMEEATTARAYALTVMEMMARVSDGHTSVWGNPDVDEVFGAAGLPIELRRIEGALVAVRVSEDVRKAGLDVGDLVLAVDGETVAARAERLRKFATASTAAALEGRLARLMPGGSANSTAVLKIQKADGSTREVSLVRDPKTMSLPPPSTDVVKIVDGNWGYADLTRLTVQEVDGLFEKIKDTRGLILDMRGYPRGTAWAIAPRINTRKAKVGAQFRRAQVSVFSDEEGESGFYFAQPLPPLPEGKSLYTAPVVMLIDDRAISQSEHSGLFFEAANGTKFIGTATAGANGDVTNFSLPGGIMVGFTGHDVRHADGRQLQRIGLVPDIEVAPTIAGIRAGRDEVLERAIRYLEQTAPVRETVSRPQ